MASLPSRAFLRSSLALWKRREAYRKNRHDHWQRLLDKARKDDKPRVELKAKRDHWSNLLKVARYRVLLREKQLGMRVAARGVDVSNNNGTVDFEKIRDAGYRFVWIKASEGIGFTDPFFLSNVRKAKAAGLKVGAYHFLTTSPVGDQAQHFAGLLRQADLGRDDLLPVVDVEKQGTSPRLAGQFVASFHAHMGVFPLIYTFPGFANPWPSDYGCKLWIAHFGARKPTVPGPWRSYAAWQHSSTASVPGVQGHCDVNRTSSLAGLIW